MSSVLAQWIMCVAVDTAFLINTCENQAIKLQYMYGFRYWFFQGIRDNFIGPYPQHLLCEAKMRIAEKYLLNRK
jgi:hypothetical protein